LLKTFLEQGYILPAIIASPLGCSRGFQRDYRVLMKNQGMLPSPLNVDVGRNA
jgi:hypothetical protein